MHSMLSAPKETVPITRPPSPLRGIARLPAFAVLLVTLLGSVLPSFAQTWVADIPAAASAGGRMNGPTFVALDSQHPVGTTWLYVSEHGEINGTAGGRILKINVATGAVTEIAQHGTADGQFISPDAILVMSNGDLIISDR